VRAPSTGRIRRTYIAGGPEAATFAWCRWIQVSVAIDCRYAHGADASAAEGSEVHLGPLIPKLLLTR